MAGRLSSAGSARLLQACVAVGGLVPVAAGAAGMVLGAGMTGEHGGMDRAGVDLDSHVRYLSGLLLAIGLGYWSCIPGIAARRARFGLLTALVVVGGLARLGGVLAHGMPSAPMLAGLGMELIVTPLLWLWQRRLAPPGSIGPA